MTCVPECANGTYFNLEEMKCSPCHVSCSTCTGLIPFCSVRFCSYILFFNICSVYCILIHSTVWHANCSFKSKDTWNEIELIDISNTNSICKTDLMCISLCLLLFFCLVLFWSFCYYNEFRAESNWSQIDENRWNAGNSEADKWTDCRTQRLPDIPITGAEPIQTERLKRKVFILFSWAFLLSRTS